MSTLDDRSSVETDAAPMLREGQRLDQPTFHAIYERMPDDFKAELIDGVVHLVNMPLYSGHGESDSSMIGLLFFYSIETPGTVVRNGVTTKLLPNSEVQPDSCLLILPECGGRSRKDGQGAMVNAPELVVEISDSSLRLDLGAKKRVYEKAGALEYLVFDVKKREFRWFSLAGERFEALKPDPDGLYRSKAFPGLWIDEAAFAEGNFQAAFATLRLGLASPKHAEFVGRLRANHANRP